MFRVNVAVVVMILDCVAAVAVVAGRVVDADVIDSGNVVIHVVCVFIVGVVVRVWYCICCLLLTWFVLLLSGLLMS